MKDSDDLLREKEDNDSYDESSSEKHWTALEKKMNANSNINKPKKILKSFIALAAIVIVLFIVYKITDDKSPASQRSILATEINSAIKPAMKGIDVPYEVFSFDASIGDTLFTKNGSIIIFPKNSVLGKTGKIITGIIEIKAREFNDGFDYSIAGIPMNYDSAGVQYKFISSAMIDIKAYQNNEILQVNPSAKPQLNLVSTNKEKNTNLYQLDTMKGQWENKGKDEVIFLEKTSRYFKNIISAGDDLIFSEDSKNSSGNGEDFLEDNFDIEKQNTKLIPPQKASGTNPIINIEIDPLSFKELMVYNNLKFEVTDHSTATVNEDSKTLWEDVQLQKGTAAGMYNAIFFAKSKKVIYRVKPVLVGKDFEAAEKLYQDKLKEYTKVAQERKLQDKEELKKLTQNANKENMIIVKDSMVVKAVMAENHKTDELNKLITLRNKYIEIQNKRQESILIDRQSKQLALEKKQRAMQLDQSLIRTFQIDGFGYWNCDMPSLPEAVPYACEFMDENLNKISFSQMHFITEGINRVMTFYNGSIALLPDKKHTAWTFSYDSFYYLNVISFDKVSWDKNKIVEVKMKKYTGKLNNYEDLKAVVFNEKFQRQ